MHFFCVQLLAEGDGQVVGLLQEDLGSRSAPPTSLALFLARSGLNFFIHIMNINSSKQVLFIILVTMSKMETTQYLPVGDHLNQSDIENTMEEYLMT